MVIAPGQPVVLGLGEDTIELPAPRPPGIADAAIAAELEDSTVAGHRMQLVRVPVTCAAELPADVIPDGSSLQRITGLIGPPCSRGCVYLQGALYDLRTTMITPACTAAAVVQQGYPIVFRLAWNDDDQAALVAQFALSTLKASRATVVRDTSVFARSLTSRFAATFQGDGRTVMQLEIPASGPVDQQKLFQAIRDERPNVVAYFVDRSNATDIFGDLSEQLPQVPLLTADTVLAGNDCELVPGARPSVGSSAAGLASAVAPCPLGPASAPRFVAVGLAQRDGAWASELDADPAEDPFLAQELDAIRVYATALRKVGQPRSDGSLVVPRQALRNAISSVRMTGQSGRIAFDAIGERRYDVGAALYELGPDSTKLVQELRR